VIARVVRQQHWKQQHWMQQRWKQPQQQNQKPHFTENAHHVTAQEWTGHAALNLAACCPLLAAASCWQLPAP